MKNEMNERMSLTECEERAKNEGYNTATFDLCGPAGRKKCKWEDAYFGCFLIEGQEGFLRVPDLKGLPLWCENFSVESELF